MLSRRRPAGRAHLVYLIVLAGAGPPAAALPDRACAPGITEPATVAAVIDGDTIALADGEHVRLVGVDTPELGHDGAPDQPGAAAARAWLAARLPPGAMVRAAADAEDRDRHGRLLRHLFLADGTNVQAALLEAGLAAPLFIPPSAAFVDCYAAAVTRAQGAQRGLWALPEYRARTPAELPPDIRGYRVVRARITAVHDTRGGGVWLSLDGPLSVTIPASSLPLFGREWIGRLAGARAEIRGMVYPYGRGLRMYLRHPLDLTVEAAENPESTPRAE